MFLATGSTFDFMQFLQIISWILIPALVIAVATTIFFHYRKKKEEAEEEDSADKLLMGSPEIVGYTRGDGEFVCFDHSPLISQYKNSLTLSHARFSALHHDFENLETRYKALAGYAIAQFRNKKEDIMGTSKDQMPRQLQQEINRIATQYKNEKTGLLAKLDLLNQSFKTLEEENEFLQEQLTLQTATNDEKDGIVEKWREENTTLKDQVAEQKYLHDVLNEKKAQIAFLQDKLEQRVRNQHELENRCTALEADLEQATHQQQLAAQLESNLRKELLHKQEEADKLHVVLCGKEEELNEREKLLSAKEEHIQRLEAVIAEMRDKEAALNTQLAEVRQTAGELQQQLSEKQVKIESLMDSAGPAEPTESAYNEFSPIAVPANQSPVISLSPAYLSRPDDEIAVH